MLVQYVESICKNGNIVIAEAVEGAEEFVPDLASHFCCPVLIKVHGKLSWPENYILHIALNAVFVHEAGFLQVAHHPEK